MVPAFTVVGYALHEILNPDRGVMSLLSVNDLHVSYRIQAGDVPAVRGVNFEIDKGEVLGLGHNLREAAGDPTAHAEMVAIRAAAVKLGQWRLERCTLVVTLEPCPMCAGALMLARISTLVLGAWDPKLGATGSVWDIVRDRRATHRVEVVGGVREAECGALLTDFFAGHRLG